MTKTRVTKKKAARKDKTKAAEAGVAAAQKVFSTFLGRSEEKGRM